VHSRHPGAGGAADAALAAGSHSLSQQPTTRPQVSNAAALATGRSGVTRRPGAGANWSTRDSGVANNQAQIQTNDLNQSSGFIVIERSTHCLANYNPSFTPITLESGRSGLGF